MRNDILERLVMDPGKRTLGVKRLRLKLILERQRFTSRNNRLCATDRHGDSFGATRSRACCSRRAYRLLLHVARSL